MDFIKFTTDYSSENNKKKHSKANTFPSTADRFQDTLIHHVTTKHETVFETLLINK